MYAMNNYDKIARAIEFINRHVNEQPGLDEISAYLHMSPFHFQRLFCKWTGVTPKRFLQTITLERAKTLLAENRPVLDVANSLGLSSGSRLYDHFVQLEAITPGEYKAGGKGMTIEYAAHSSPFGNIFIAVTLKGICKLAFVDKEDISEQVNDLSVLWPHATLRKNTKGTQKLVKLIFPDIGEVNKPISLHVSGTNFQINVWKALLEIPPGTLTSYSHIAEKVGKPRAARAVGSAIGDNPVAFLIPCHRVIQQSGRIGGYHWGETRMHAMHAWESARFE